MAIVVEDGTGLPNAESYISVADATAYHAARGNAAWAALASDAVREQMLRQATDFMGQLYRPSWKGYRTNRTQALDWPRNLVYVVDLFGGRRDLPYLWPNNSVPPEVPRACAELALRAIGGQLAADLDQGLQSEEVGPLKTAYDVHSPQYRRYRAVHLLLRPYLDVQGVSTMSRVNRT